MHNLTRTTERSFAPLDHVRHALARLLLSARAYHRVLREARTIADLAQKSTLAAEHIAEAIQYRRLDASF